MTEKRITRRRVIHGAGAIGVAGVFGSSIVTAQQTETAQDGQSAAVRVVHTSPDAPNIDVRIDGETQIEGLGFSDASSYTEIESGSRQVTVVAAEEGVLGGLFDDILGGDQEGTALFDQQIEVEQGTTYTLVAFGEVAQGPAAGDGGSTGNETGGPAGNETGEIAQNETGGVGQNETDGMEAAAVGEVVVESLAFGEHETFEVSEGEYALLVRRMMEDTSVGVETDESAGGTQPGGENDTAGVGDNETDMFGDNETGDVGGIEPGDTAGSERAFQVEVLEGELSDPGDGQTRMRVFHAVPDVNSVSITAVSQEELAQQGGNETGQGANDTGGLGENDTGGPGENDTGGDNRTEAAPGETGEDVRETDVSLSGGAVYSGFATGYFNPEAAAAAEDNQTEDNETDGLFGDNQTADNETAGGQSGDNETGDTQTDSSDDVVQDVTGVDFEFVTVEDAQGGERADGGTDGLL
jgi:hypothetical protein